MVIASVVCFALAAAGGVLLASLHARGSTPPLALAGFVLLLAGVVV